MRDTSSKLPVSVNKALSYFLVCSTSFSIDALIIASYKIFGQLISLIICYGMRMHHWPLEENYQH